MTTSDRRFLHRVPTPVGIFAILTDAGDRLHAAGFTEGHPRMEQTVRAVEATPTGCRSSASDAIARYFAGELHALDDLRVAMHGTPFQHDVWSALRAIPVGETRSYADVARIIGRPRAVRAVGLANGSNPIGLIVPCHRVIGSNGKLTGYGGGLERKRWLLEHEAGRAQRAVGTR